MWVLWRVRSGNGRSQGCEAGDGRREVIVTAVDPVLGTKITRCPTQGTAREIRRDGRGSVGIGCLVVCIDPQRKEKRWPYQTRQCGLVCSSAVQRKGGRDSRCECGDGDSKYDNKFTLAKRKRQGEHRRGQASSGLTDLALDKREDGKIVFMPEETSSSPG